MAKYSKLIGLGVTIGSALFGFLGDKIKDQELSERIKKEVHEEVNIAMKQYFETR